MSFFWVIHSFPYKKKTSSDIKFTFCTNFLFFKNISMRRQLARWKAESRQQLTGCHLHKVFLISTSTRLSVISIPTTMPSAGLDMASGLLNNDVLQDYYVISNNFNGKIQVSRLFDIFSKHYLAYFEIIICGAILISYYYLCIILLSVQQKTNFSHHSTMLLVCFGGLFCYCPLIILWL